MLYGATIRYRLFTKSLGLFLVYPITILVTLALELWLAWGLISAGAATPVWYWMYFGFGVQVFMLSAYPPSEQHGMSSGWMAMYAWWAMVNTTFLCIALLIGLSFSNRAVTAESIINLIVWPVFYILEFVREAAFRQLEAEL